MQTQLEASRPSSSIKINQQEVRGHSFISTLYLAQYFAHCVPNTYIYTYIHTYNAHICIYSIRMNKYCVYVCGNVHGRKNKEKVALRCRLEAGKRKSKHTETSIFTLPLPPPIFPYSSCWTSKLYTLKHFYKLWFILINIW